jgi:WD40 repeat protein
MHLIIILAIVVIAIFFLLKNSKASYTPPQDQLESSTPQSSVDLFSDNALIFISRGKMFHKQGGNALQELQSPYIQNVMDRMERSRQRHSWKEGTAFESSFVSEASNLPADQHQLMARSAQFRPDGKALYFLSDDKVDGLFEYNFESGDEKRLIHQQQLLLEDLSIDPLGKRLACSQQSKNGTANIALMDIDGSNYQEVTAGDTLDNAPAWIPGAPDQLLFQSAGVARSEEGYILALGPSSIQMLDLQKGSLTTVREEDGYDFLQPKVTPNGDLLFIQRPYEPPRYSGSNLLVDFLLFPFRLLRALFHYLNFFSLMYSRKPLTSASGPKVQADLKEMLIKGKRINAENALKQETAVNGVRSLVPKSWRLIKRSQNGEEQILATNVASYDITNKGQIVFSNGYGLFILDGSNESTVVLKDKLITDVALR